MVQAPECAYIYCAARPLTMVDASGENPVVPIVIIIGIGDLWFRIKPCMMAALAEADRLHEADDKLAHCYFACRATRCLHLYRLMPITPIMEDLVGRLIERYGSNNDEGDANSQTVGIICAYTNRTCGSCCRIALARLRCNNPSRYRIDP